jgi:imipenem/basic amino acid-specific outer membrane pore
MQVMKWSVIALAVAAGSTQMAFASSQSESNGFVDDSSLNILTRSYYMNRDFRSRGPGTQSYREEWALGLIGNYESGFTQGTVGFGVDAHAFLGLKLDTGRGRNGNGLLPINDDGRAADDYSSAGGAVKVRVSNTVLKYGDLMPANPVFATGTARLIPASAEGFMLTSNEIENLTLDAGHFTSSRDMNSTDHDGRIIAAYASFGPLGAQDARQVDYLGGSYSVNDNLSVTLYGSEFKDIWRQYYGNANYNIALSDDQALNFDFNIYRTDEQGKELAGKLDNTIWSLAAAYSMGAHTFTLAHQRSNGDTPMDYLLLGGEPGQFADSIFLGNSVAYGDFNAPNEKSWQARYDLDMTTFGVPGLSFMTRYITGDDIDGTKADPNGAYAGLYGKNQSRWERDVEVRYVVQEGSAKDLSFRLRQATYRSDDFDDDLNQVRLIIEYPLQIM